MNDVLEIISQNGAAVITTAIFIWYLERKDRAMEKMISEWREEIKQLRKAIQNVLYKK